MNSFQDFTILLNSGDCDNEKMLLTEFIEANEDFPIDDLISILQLNENEEISLTWCLGNSFSIKRIS